MARTAFASLTLAGLVVSALVHAPAKAATYQPPVKGEVVLRVVTINEEPISLSNSFDLTFDAKGSWDENFGSGLKFYYMYANVGKTLNMKWRATNPDGTPRGNTLVYLVVNKAYACAKTKFYTDLTGKTYENGDPMTVEYVGADRKPLIRNESNQLVPMPNPTPTPAPSIEVPANYTVVRDWCGDAAGGYSRGQSLIPGYTDANGYVDYSITNFNLPSEGEAAPLALNATNTYTADTPCVNDPACLGTTITATLLKNPNPALKLERLEDKDLLNIHFASNGVQAITPNIYAKGSNGTKTLKFRVTDLKGNPQEGQTVNFTSADAGNVEGDLSVDSAVTDSNGEVTVSADSGIDDGTAEGVQIITARLAGTRSKSASVVNWSETDPTPTPTGVSATAGYDGKATVRWNRVTGANWYIVRSTPGDILCGSGATSCVVEGLTNSTSYTFTVTALSSTLPDSEPSEATAAVTPIKMPMPTVTVPPAVSGLLKVGKTLTAAKGTWSLATSWTYKWYACTRVGAAATSLPTGCVAITGGTRSTLTLGTAQKYKYIRVAVTGKNTSGSVTRYSATKGKVS